MCKYRVALLWILVISCSAALTGCASAPKDPQGDSDTMHSQLADLHQMMTNQAARLEALETRIGSLADKVSATQSSVDNLMANRKALPAPVVSHPSDGAGTEPAETLASNDPEAGFVSDRAIQDFRKGQILLDARKYPEAALAFSAFVEKYPDHPLAGSAQFEIGESYFKQKDYKKAVHELERVLTSYDRSPHISDTLRDLADAEDGLRMPEQAARHRQLLTSLFPQSPAANLSAGPASVESAPAVSNTPTVTPAPGSGANRLDEPPQSSAIPTAPLTPPPGNAEATQKRPEEAR